MESMYGAQARESSSLFALLLWLGHCSAVLGVADVHVVIVIDMRSASKARSRES